MAHLDFGWSMASGPRANTGRADFLAALEQGFGVMRGHFRSACLIAHLQVEANPLLEGWMALAYLAAQHPEFDFGHTVLLQSFRNPALLAKMAATFQCMSSGRFILGIGARWKEDEYGSLTR